MSEDKKEEGVKTPRGNSIYTPPKGGDGQKRGPFSREERDTIFSSPLSAEELGVQLKRNAKQISKIRKEREYWTHKDERDDYIVALHAEHFWKQIKEKLIPDEYEYFEQTWADFSIQFSAQGILPTDKHGMQDLIITDILLHRHQKEERDIRISISAMQEELTKEMGFADSKISSDIKHLQKTIDAYRATLNSLIKGNNELQKTKDNKFKDLKATRAQRLEKIEKSGKSIFDLVNLLSEREQRFKEGKTLAISTESARIYTKNLQDYHTYENDSVDKPFLLPTKKVSEDLE